jgi:hypothetical protein
MLFISTRFGRHITRMRNVTNENAWQDFQGQLELLLDSYRPLLHEDDLLLQTAMREYEECCVSEDMLQAA